MWKIVSIRSNRNISYVQDFLLTLDPPTAARAARVLSLLKSYGPKAGEPYVKKINQEIFEARVLGKVQVRILFTVKGEYIYLLHAFIKKTQKTPPHHIALAKQRIKQISA